ncbi:MAG: helix-turn-helix domain-containing protein [Bacteroidota bacterium]
MNTEYQILFFFAVLGAFNALFLSIYFAFLVKHRSNANYFIAALLVVIGVKIITSVFLHFDWGLSQAIVEIGFSANALIGPFFYLYVKSSTNENTNTQTYWWLHIILSVIAIPVIGLLHPLTFSYVNGPTLLSQYVVVFIYFQWFIYLVLTFKVLKRSFRKVFLQKFSSNDEETWLVSLFLGISIFWIGPIITSHTTYMVGALSFSIIFYGLLFLWIFKFRKTSEFFEPHVKYASKKIDPSEAEMLSAKLNRLFKEEELFRNPNLKIADVADELNMPSQRLSQFLNDNMGKSFSSFINEHRINAAKKMLLQNNQYTTEAIGYECGFNSKSTFFTTFKKLTGHTPANFKSQTE